MRCHSYGIKTDKHSFMGFSVNQKKKCNSCKVPILIPWEKVLRLLWKWLIYVQYLFTFFKVGLIAITLAPLYDLNLNNYLKKNMTPGYQNDFIRTGMALTDSNRKINSIFYIKHKPFAFENWQNWLVCIRYWHYFKLFLLLSLLVKWLTSLVYSIQVNRGFYAFWLANSEVVINVVFPFKQIFWNKVIF